MHRVVVTGMGVASPLGCNIEDFWRRLVDGCSGIVALFDEIYAGLPVRIGGVVSGCQVADIFEFKTAPYQPRFTAWHYSCQPGCCPGKIDNRSTGRRG